MQIDLTKLPAWAKIEVTKEDLLAFANQISDNCRAQMPNAPESATEIMTVDEAADFLNLAKQTVYQLSSQRKLPVIKKGKRIYFKRSQLIAWLEEGQQKIQSEIDQEALDYITRKRR